MLVPKVILQIDTSRACGRGILLGVSKYCRLFSHWRLSQSMPLYFAASGQSQALCLPEDWLADGFIIGSGEIPEGIRRLGIPTIGIDIRQPIAGMPNIFGDAQAIADMALTHFMDHGFTQLAYCEFEGISWAVERGKYFTRHAKEKGLGIAKYEVKTSEGHFARDDEIAAIATWLNGLPHPLGLLACNDDCAKLVSAACELEGIDVPKDVAILGVDDDELVCLPNSPPLSSIALDFETAGFEAARLLDKIIKGQEKSASQRIILKPTHIKIRRSTDTFAVTDPEVQSALQYIANHSHESIIVPDVIEATTLSRRGLEYRFKAVLGRSINKVIRAKRAERISHMLLETDLTVSQIAYELGFTDIEHISRYFSSEKGISPSAFRKKYRQYSR